ncbi:MAG: glutaminyl-peptide cyclotransferase [Smithellaceae bacterium]|jgi:glutaminyl-peptide cyclotransferase|nr:glutaminyl-peptide cyclotransferase [Smithellaceae bacterium]MDD3258650.1 glutaminyl-peptide cyclotransferase [Smithellaceae bacterium]MDD3848875.1 glutaminyl-peptide cyclotransferase [Smithellaceae bacterium]
MTRNIPKIFAALLLLSLCVLLPCLTGAERIPPGKNPFSLLMKTKAPISAVAVQKIHPHDSDAFTQGLIVMDGVLCESTGLLGRSTLACKDIDTGKVLRQIQLPPEFFGEGIALLKGRIYQVTWQNENALVYDAASLREIRRMKYSGEGWGLTSDGKSLLMSDGSSIITIRDPKSFQVQRRIRVQDGDRPVSRLNELEFVRGEIWANIYMEDLIARISPQTGRVKGWIDLSALRSYLPANARVDVLNGIAFDAKQNRIWVTGKYWPHLFEIQITP